MNALAQTWATLPLRRQVVVALSALAMFAAVLGVARFSSQPQMALLYSGLDPSAAGEVLGVLDQEGAAYDVRGSAIYVDATSRDALRMTLATQGLPSGTAQGYELLDSLSGFGTTAQMFDSAYWRAREGELARTLLANPDVNAARVHVSAVSGRPFDRSFVPTASVAITPRGAPVSDELARAARFLVGAAVPGLKPENVSVIDSRTGVLIGAESPFQTDPSERAEVLRQNVERLLEARVGPGNAVVEVAVDIVGEAESITERQIDPASRVQISTETEERSDTATDQNAAGGVTVASNLPSGNGASGGGQSNSQASETRERVNFDVSETRREVTRVPGGISRISVAVLVDGIRTLDASGTETWLPRPDEELAALRELIASAVGFSADRNDSITIKTMEFQPIPEAGTLAEGPSPGLALDVGSLARLGVFAGVALILGLFVIRPALAARPVEPVAALPAPPPPMQETAQALSGTIDDPVVEPAMALVTADMSDFGSLPSATNPVDRLRALIQERRGETMEILRTWVEEPEGSA
jgi:flagellar M-ring protein FliF